MRKRFYKQSGVTLLETIVFIVVVSIALAAVVRVYTQVSTVDVDGSIRSRNLVDPALKTRALELAQAKLDEILSRKFDENTPTGGVPHCNSTGGTACAGIAVDSDFDDVGDYNGTTDTTHPNHSITVSVVEAGAELGLSAEHARRITVTVTVPSGSPIQLSAYKVNF